MEGVSNAAQGGGGAVQSIPGWGGSHPCVGAAGMSCCFLLVAAFLVALVSRAAGADPTLRNFAGGFLWLPVGLGLRFTPTLWGHLKAPAGMSLSSPVGLESIKSHLPVPPSRNLPVDHPRSLLVSWSSRAGREHGTANAVGDAEKQSRAEFQM